MNILSKNYMLDEYGNYILPDEFNTDDVMIKAVRPLQPYENLIIEVDFVNGITKHFDVGKEIKCRPEFKPLADDIELFKKVRTHKYGGKDNPSYSVYWNDDIDISEIHLWFQGEETDKYKPKQEKNTFSKIY